MSEYDVSGVVTPRAITMLMTSSTATLGEGDEGGGRVGKGGLTKGRGEGRRLRITGFQLQPQSTPRVGATEPHATAHRHWGPKETS